MATEKFKEMILYIAQESECDRNFGATKLNKILFFCDFLGFRAHGSSISEQRYFKLPYGPAPRSLKPAITELVAEEACIEVERNHFGRPQKRIVVRREAKVEVFTAKEIALINSVIRALWDNSAQEVSDLSHHFIGWQAAGDLEDIPYETIFLGDPRGLSLTEEEIRFGQELVAEEMEACA
jgi:hypothetical protein